MKQLKFCTQHQNPSHPAGTIPRFTGPTVLNQSISVYRVSLVKDESVSFGNVRLANSQEAQALIQNLILTKGQPDREQFVVALLNAKNEMIGLNIVSVGAYHPLLSILVKS
jgi:hypothetical protein